MPVAAVEKALNIILFSLSGFPFCDVSHNGDPLNALQIQKPNL